MVRAAVIPKVMLAATTTVPGSLAAQLKETFY
jgi:hypothetical protein